MDLNLDTGPRSLRSPSELLKLAGALGASLVLVACGASAKSPESRENAPYAEHQVVATVFYVGEQASKDNAGIDNISTEWETDATKAFGGVDDPDARTPEGLPVFAPKENPFYVALPASEFTSNGPIKEAWSKSPWAGEAKNLSANGNTSLFKGRWVQVSTPGSNKKVYGQWLDTGPSDNPAYSKDYNYVFGDETVKPKNDYNLKAGIDLSPAMAYQLGFGIEEGSAEVAWKFVDQQDVPEGLWTKYPAITNETHWDD